jgi:hypothetical protein
MRGTVDRAFTESSRRTVAAADRRNAVGWKHSAIMLVSGVITYGAASSNVGLGLGLLAALLMGSAWHLEQRLEKLKTQIERLSDQAERSRR